MTDEAGVGLPVESADSPGGSEIGAPLVVPHGLWRHLEDRHHVVIDRITADHLDRRRHGQSHPVIDFLFTYYRTSVGVLRRWHPGAGILLEGAQHTERVDWQFYRPERWRNHTGLVVDLTSLCARRGERINRAREIVSGTMARPGSLSCFGLHEWAMLYRTDEQEVRHSSVPLRLSHDDIDRVVESSELRCTHMDAFRFFTEPAVGLNARKLRRDEQPQDEQPACLHAGMDLYRWATALGPSCPSELLVDCLRAAYSAREMDMRASPYDLSAWGLDPVPVESAEGRVQFAAFQRTWIDHTTVLRRRLMQVFDLTLAPAAAENRLTTGHSV